MRRSPLNPDDFTMSFGAHLEELRKRLLLALAVPIPLMVAFYAFSRPLIDVLRRPVDEAMRSNGLPAQLQVLTPAEFFLTQLKLSFIAALVLSAPWVLYQLWLFVKPGLYRHEQRFIYFLLPFSALMTFAATALTYWVILPLMLTVLISLGSAGAGAPAAPAAASPEVQRVLQANPQPPVRVTAPADPQPNTAWLLWPDMELYVVTAGPDGRVVVHHVPKPANSVAQVYRLSSYINFVLFSLLATAIAFQLPLVMLLLGWVGLITPDTLRRKRKYAIVILSVVAAVVTPSPDPLSMLAMLLPLYGLYELSILLVRFVPARAVAEGRIVTLRRSRRSVPRSEHDDRSDSAESATAATASDADHRPEAR